MYCIDCIKFCNAFPWIKNLQFTPDQWKAPNLQQKLKEISTDIRTDSHYHQLKWDLCLLAVDLISCKTKTIE